MDKQLTFAEILADPENLVCKCQHDGSSYPVCQYRTKCRECIIIHKSEKGVPTCIRDYSENNELPDMAKRAAAEEAILSDPENFKCVCTVESDGKPCEFRGRCKECIAIHRYYRSFPACVRDHAIMKAAE